MKAATRKLPKPTCSPLFQAYICPPITIVIAVDISREYLVNHMVIRAVSFAHIIKLHFNLPSIHTSNCEANTLGAATWIPMPLYTLRNQSYRVGAWPGAPSRAPGTPTGPRPSKELPLPLLMRLAPEDGMLAADILGVVINRYCGRSFQFCALSRVALAVKVQL